MEYNPLDLLASAAELQQRHDDPPIMTRPIKAKTLTSRIITINSIQKENKETIQTNSKNGGVIVVKKIKIGGNSDLEKMLDEHNYGNAKKGVKFEKNLQSVSDDHLSPVNDNSEHSERDHAIDDVESGVNDHHEILSAEIQETCENDSPTINYPSAEPDLSTNVCTNLESDKQNLSKTENVDKSLEDRCKQNSAISLKDCQLNGVQYSSQDIKLHDNNNLTGDIKVQNDKSIQLKSEEKLVDIKSSSLNKLCEDAKLDLDPCKETVDMKETLTSDVCKKVVVTVSPENSIYIEENHLNEKKTSPVLHLDSSEADTYSLDVMEKNDKDETLNDMNKGIVKSQIISTCSKSENMNPLLTADATAHKHFKTPKLNNSLRVSCDTGNYLDLEEKLSSCDTQKSQFDLDPFCNGSSNSINLLSPDRRNPDSVGIVESPVANSLTDSTNLTGNPVSNAFTDSLNTSKAENSSKNNDSCNSSISVISRPGKHDSKLIDSNLNGNKQSVIDLKAYQKGDNDSTIKEYLASGSIAGKKTTDGEVVLEIGRESHQSITQNLDNKANVFRFESDHCYAGFPGKVDGVDKREMPAEDEETDSDDEEIDTSSSSVSPTELSQDSGYGDISQSPDESSVPHVAEKLVPVLISINKSGSLTVHTDKGISKELPRQIFTLSEKHKTVDSNANLINANKAQNLNTAVSGNVRPLLLSPIGKGTASVLIDPSKIIKDPKTVNSMVSTQGKGLILQNPIPQASPPKFGKFRIGTFASFSNTGMDLDSPVKSKAKSEMPPKVSLFSQSVVKKEDSLRSSSSFKGNLGLNTSLGYTDHIQHDHDYCIHSLMPSTIESVKESHLQKELQKSKSSLVKAKRADLEQKNDKTSKRKGKNSKSLVEKDECPDEMEMLLDEERYRDLPTFADTVRSKTRTEKYIEQKSSEPKMKITGSSNFQDQFVYFMNTKKRSRRRESRDSHAPSSVPFDRIFLPPPKPGDIVVPHLTDADIENLKHCGKINKPSYFVSQSSQADSFSSSKLTVPNSSQSSNSETNVDEESKIINTILSLENENEFLPEEQVFGSSEMYGQSGDVNLLPEQMNLTQEQMELLFSAVDEVQNSSPSLVSEKLDSAVPDDSTFGQFSVEEGSYTNPLDKASLEKKNKDEDEVSTDHSSTDQENLAVKEISRSPSVIKDSEEEKVDDSYSVTKDDELDTESGLAKRESSPTTLTTTDNLTGNISTDTISCKPSSPPNTLSHTVASCSQDQVNSFSQNLSSTVNHDLPLPSLDKSSLDILGCEYRLDRSDLFPDASLQDTAPPTQTSYPVPTPLDYDAPWIVTVSMYWNDLPAIMINNLPYVRLVDIHKQILPAKDTGILKKRCQLMGIEVGNCSEMQRYFLVQYGKAVNSKSTLIISKDAAKVLIGYYVEPQPVKSSSSTKEHKSIIEHRREQLRRIALQKRAALRAERLEKERASEQKAGSNLLKPVEVERPIEADQSAAPVPPRQRHSISRFQPTFSPGARLQRSTRHKKINFLELLRGDNSSTPHDDHTAENSSNKKKSHSTVEVSGLKPNSKRKRPLTSGEVKNIKVIKYKYSESGESTEDESSEYNEEAIMDSSDSEKEVKCVKKSSKKRTSLFNAKTKKRKFKKSVVLKRNVVKIPSFKVKLKNLTKLPSIQMSKNQVTPRKTLSESKPLVEVDRNFDTDMVSKENNLSSEDYDSCKDTVDMNGENASPKVIVETVVPPKVIVENVYGDFEAIKSRLECDDDKCERESSDEQTSEAIHTEGDEGTCHSSSLETECSHSLPSENIVVNNNSLDVIEHQGSRNTENNPCEVVISEPDLVSESNNLKEQQIQVNEAGSSLADCSSSTDVRSKDTKDDSAKVDSTSIVDEVNHLSEQGNSVDSHGSSVKKVNAKLTNLCSDIEGTSVDNVNFLFLNKQNNVQEEATPLRIFHRDISTENSNIRSRRQLGEVFVEQYNNKRSFCIRCYTCRKMMSVDSFLRHLHDVSGGLISTDVPQTIEPSDPEMTDSEVKAWEVFQRKKELFDNNQLPSDVTRSNIVYNVDSDSNHSLAEKSADENTRGPIIIQTPVSPVKREVTKSISKPIQKKKERPSQPRNNKVIEKSKSWTSVTSGSTVDGIRASSRKRKVSQLYSSDEYTFFKKLPRLQKELKEGTEYAADSLQDKNN